MPSIIYSIRSPNLPTKEYVGSSDLDARTRMQRHLTACKRYADGKCPLYCSSFEIINAGGATITILETLEAPTRAELLAKECEVLGKAPDRGMTVVNKRKPGLKAENMPEGNRRLIKKWYEDVGSQIYSCECGANVKRVNRKIHFASKKHQAHLTHILNDVINEFSAIGNIF